MRNNCTFNGFLVADAERRTSTAGKSGVRLRIGVGKAEAAWGFALSCLARQSRPLPFSRGDTIRVEGRLTGALAGIRALILLAMVLHPERGDPLDTWHPPAALAAGAWPRTRR